MSGQVISIKQKRRQRAVLALEKIVADAARPGVKPKAKLVRAGAVAARVAELIRKGAL